MSQRLTHSKEVYSPAAPEPVGPYSQAVVHGGLVYASGQIPIDPTTGRLIEGEIEDQARRVLQNLSVVLKAAGSSLDEVLKTTVYLVNLSLFPRLNAIYAEAFLRKPYPARATVEVTSLPLGAQVEIDAIAAVAKKPQPES